MSRYCVQCGGELSEREGGYHCPHCRCGGAACEGVGGRGLSRPPSNADVALADSRRREEGDS